MEWSKAVYYTECGESGVEYRWSIGGVQVEQKC